jgi:hypothetical protein
VRRDVANLKAAANAAGIEEAFMTSIAVGTVETFCRGQDACYKSVEAFLDGIAKAMAVEYRAIVDAGFVLQLDDPGLPDTCDMLDPHPTLAEYRRYAMLRVEALNHALHGIPEDRVRHHICWGSWHGPHTTDLPLRDIVDVMLNVKAQAYSVEAGNVRHEHEYKVWRDVKLPDGKILIPGVVSHATNVVEHPEVVANPSRSASGRGRLPAWVVRIESTLRFIRFLRSPAPGSRSTLSGIVAPRHGGRRFRSCRSSGTGRQSAERPGKRDRRPESRYQSRPHTNGTAP